MALYVPPLSRLLAPSSESSTDREWATAWNAGAQAQSDVTKNLTPLERVVSPSALIHTQLHPPFFFSPTTRETQVITVNSQWNNLRSKMSEQGLPFCSLYYPTQFNSEQARQILRLCFHTLLHLLTGFLSQMACSYVFPFLFLKNLLMAGQLLASLHQCQRILVASGWGMKWRLFAKLALLVCAFFPLSFLRYNRHIV